MHAVLSVSTRAWSLTDSPGNPNLRGWGAGRPSLNFRGISLARDLVEQSIAAAMKSVSSSWSANDFCLRRLDRSWAGSRSQSTKMVRHPHHRKALVKGRCAVHQRWFATRQRYRSGPRGCSRHIILRAPSGAFPLPSATGGCCPHRRAHPWSPVRSGGPPADTWSPCNCHAGMLGTGQLHPSAL